MKYPQLVSTPAVVQEWLEAELECLGIDSAAYARTVLSLLSRDSVDPAEVIQSGYVLVANKCGRGAGGSSGPHPPRTRGEELKRAEVIECLRSASEDTGGIQSLVDRLIGMLKQLPAAGPERLPPATIPPGAEVTLAGDPVTRYEAAFPALSRDSPGVIPLTYFSKMARGGPTAAAAVAASAADLWHSEHHHHHQSAAVWPTPLSLSLLVATVAEVAGPAPAAEPPPPPPPPPPPEPAILPTAETHFQPIRRDADAEPADWGGPATYDARLYTRSESGGLYLEDERAAGRAAAEPPQKYMIYHEPAAGRGLAPKFKLSANEKYCQTDEAAPEDGGGPAGADLLQILVSGEQGGGAARGAGPDDDSSYEVLSSLQQTLHSIYEDEDSGAEREPGPAPGRPPEPPERRQSAFARVRRRPSAEHRPLYLRGGAADALLAAVYTGSPGWKEEVSEAEHRPLYARQPASAGAGFAEHRQLRSGRISGAVYRQGPTEYPALRYQLAGRDLTEVTFCRLSGDAHSAAARKEDVSDQSGVWESASDAVRSSREPSVASDAGPWQAAEQPVSTDATLWQAAGERERRDRSADRALWDARRQGSAESARPGTAEMAFWEPAERESLWEAGQEERRAPASIWQPLVQREASIDDGLWEVRDEPPQRDTSLDEPLWESCSTNRDLSVERTPWELAADTVSERTLWDSPGEIYQLEKADKAIWEAPSDFSFGRRYSERPAWTGPEDGRPPSVERVKKALWASPEGPGRRDASAERDRERAVWEAQEERWEAADVSGRWQGLAWEPPLGPAAPEEEEEVAWPAGGGSLWDGAGPAIRRPEQMWRAGSLGPDEPAQEATIRRLLWSIGGEAGLYSADELADTGRNWEFIDENNVKNKIDTDVGEPGPLAAELSGGGPGWRMLPALRQLSECLGLTEGRPLPDGVALKAWALEEQWRRDDGAPRPAQSRRNNRRSDRKRPCSFFMEGNCKRNDCKFSHDLSTITCVFWEEGGCFKGVHCPFLHGYPPEEDDDGDSSDSAKRAVPKKSFKLEKEDFPSLHMKKWHRNEEEDAKRGGRRHCRRHKSFSDAGLGVGGGEPELARPGLAGRGKRRRHHSKSEGVRPADAGARRP